jgi:hypothetical protein
MTDITVHIASNDWCVHFVVTATQIPIGPWLLFDSNDEIKAKVFTWGNVAEEVMTKGEIPGFKCSVTTVIGLFKTRLA